MFGLGNKTYEHYNAVARFVDSTLETLGATRVYEKGEGDDNARFVSCRVMLLCHVCVCGSFPAFLSRNADFFSSFFSALFCIREMFVVLDE